MYRIFVTILVSTILSACAHTQKNADSSRDAVSVLLNAEYLSHKIVGFSPTVSDEYIAFNKIYESPQADSTFKYIYSMGTIAGKLYALCGLYFTDHEFFLVEVEKLKKFDWKIIIWSGDTGLGDNLRDVLEGEECDDLIDYSNLEKSTAEWKRRNPGKKYRCSCDFVNGCWPHTLKRDNR